jgi:hypothetical protein
MSAPIRVGLVGCGNAAVFHYASLMRVTGIPVEVVGVTSARRERREEFARRRGIRAFDALADMLPEVDVIDNCTPGYAHEPVSIAAFEAGKHVIVEKPFTGCGRTTPTSRTTARSTSRSRTGWWRTSSPRSSSWAECTTGWRSSPTATGRAAT